MSVPLEEHSGQRGIPGYPQTQPATLIKLTTDEGIEGYSAGSAMGTERKAWAIYWVAT